MKDRELLAIMAAILAAGKEDTRSLREVPASYVSAAAALLDEADRYVAEREIVREQLYQKEPLP